MTLAVKSLRSDFDLTAASAYNSELVKQKLKIMRTLGLQGTIEDMLISLSDQIHLVKLVGPNTVPLPRGGQEAEQHRHRAHSRCNKHLTALT